MALNPISSLLATLLSLREQQDSRDLEERKFHWTQEQTNLGRELQRDMQREGHAHEAAQLGRQNHYNFGQQVAATNNAGLSNIQQMLANQMAQAQAGLQARASQGRSERAAQSRQPTMTELLSLAGRRGQLYAEGMINERVGGRDFTGAVDAGPFGLGRQ